MFHFYIPWNRQKTPGVAFHKGTSHLICAAEYWKNFQISFTSSKPALRSYGLRQNSLKLKQYQFSVPNCALRCQKLKSSSLICVTRKSIIYSFSICSPKLKNKQFFGTKLGLTVEKSQNFQIPTAPLETIAALVFIWNARRCRILKEVNGSISTS